MPPSLYRSCVWIRHCAVTHGGSGDLAAANADADWKSVNSDEVSLQLPADVPIVFDSQLAGNPLVKRSLLQKPTELSTGSG